PTHVPSGLSHPIVSRPGPAPPRALHSFPTRRSSDLTAKLKTVEYEDAHRRLWAQPMCGREAEREQKVQHGRSADQREAKVDRHRSEERRVGKEGGSQELSYQQRKKETTRANGCS